MRTVVGWLTP